MRSTEETKTEVNPPTNLPPRDLKFVGRFDELRQIHELLPRNRRVGLRQQAVPHTQGGMGKTAVAIAYGWKHLIDYPGGVFFLDVNSGSFVSELASLAELLGCLEKLIECFLSPGSFLGALGAPEFVEQLIGGELVARGRAGCIRSVVSRLPNQD